jgi:hypothetical protein
MVARLDDFIGRLGEPGAFNTTVLPVVLDVHEMLVAVASEAVGRLTEPFCSRYLNFHFPQRVPIMATRAEASAFCLSRRAQPRSRALIARYRGHCHATSR